jgi:membrane-associated phospholipid phosphatase
MRTNGWRRVVRELVLVAAFLGVYEEIRWHMVQAGAAAASHALSIVSAERALGLFHEQAVQAVFTPWDTVTDAFNAYYGGTHFLVPAAVLAWLLLRHPEQYARARTALAVTTAAAFVCFWLYPVAPPRLLPGRFGIVDTLTAAARSGHFETTLINTAGDQYASMPSLHVAWAVWCALALYPAVRHRTLRVLVVAYPVMTTLVVVATGNHFFLDAVAGALLACLTWAVVSRVARRGGEQEPHPGDQDGVRHPVPEFAARSRSRREGALAGAVSVAHECHHMRLLAPGTGKSQCRSRGRGPRLPLAGRAVTGGTGGSGCGRSGA